MAKGPKAPKQQEIPPPAPPKPMEVTSEPVKKAVSDKAKKLAESRGRQSTLITSNVGSRDKKTIIGIK